VLGEGGREHDQVPAAVASMKRILVLGAAAAVVTLLWWAHRANPERRLPSERLGAGWR
jgi:hypothetical protein